ncbi:MAG: RNA-binding protein [Methanobacteriota archaeon]
MNKKKLIVGKLKFTVTEDQLMALFSKHGKVLNIKVMEGKGYAFIEMETPQQAWAIKNTLSEMEFEGRRLLIDDVPSKQNAAQKRTRGEPEFRPARRVSEPGKDRGQREYRSGVPESVRTIDEVHHLTDVTEEFKKSLKPDKDSRKKVQQQKSHSYTDKANPRAERPSAVRESSKPSAGLSERDRPKKSFETAGESQNKTGRPVSPTRKSERRSRDQKPKPVKEKPPKNPHPYQGSKKSKKPAQHEEELKNSSSEPEENEKRNYLRYWATISEKRVNHQRD